MKYRFCGYFIKQIFIFQSKRNCYCLDFSKYSLPTKYYGIICDIQLHQFLPSRFAATNTFRCVCLSSQVTCWSRVPSPTPLMWNWWRRRPWGIQGRRISRSGNGWKDGWRLWDWPRIMKHCQVGFVGFLKPYGCVMWVEIWLVKHCQVGFVVFLKLLFH